MKTNDVIILIPVLSAGLMAGIFLTWTNAVKPGIGKLDDMVYLSALQSMNRVILNPLFFLVFLLPIVSIPISAIMNFGSKGIYDFRLLLISTIIYLAGVFLVTLMGNIPLNELLNNTNLEKLSLGDLSELRKKIENKWNQYNLIRTIASFVSFLLLVLSLLMKK